MSSRGVWYGLWSMWSKRVWAGMFDPGTHRLPNDLGAGVVLADNLTIATARFARSLPSRNPRPFLSEADQPCELCMGSIWTSRACSAFRCHCHQIPGSHYRHTRERFSDIGWRRSPPTTPQMVLRHRSCHSPHPATAHPTSPVPPPARRCARRARRARRFGWHGRSAERSFSGEVWAWNRRNMEELTRAKRCTKSCGFHWSFKLGVSACNLFNHPLSTVPSPGKVQHGPTNENNLILSNGFGFKITVLETEYTRLVVQALFPARTKKSPT